MIKKYKIQGIGVLKGRRFKFGNVKKKMLKKKYNMVCFKMLSEKEGLILIFFVFNITNLKVRNAYFLSMCVFWAVIEILLWRQ